MKIPSPSISSSDHYHCLESAWQLLKSPVFNLLLLKTTFVFIYMLPLSALPFVFSPTLISLTYLNFFHFPFHTSSALNMMTHTSLTLIYVWDILISVTETYTTHISLILFQAQLFGTMTQLNQLWLMTNWALIYKMPMKVKISGSFKPSVYYFVCNYSECISLPDTVFPGNGLNLAKGPRGRCPELQIRLTSRDASTKKPQFLCFVAKRGFLGLDPWSLSSNLVAN